MHRDDNKAGHLRHASLLDDRLLTAPDLPRIEAQLLEKAYRGHPLGVRGDGEARGGVLDCWQIVPS